MVPSIRLDQIISDDNVLIGNLIHDIDKRILSIYNKEMSAYGLTWVQALCILYLLRHKDRKVYQKDLEKYLGLTNPSVTSLVKNLIAQDFIYKIKDKEDGRFYHLHLTPKSLALENDLLLSVQIITEHIQKILAETEYQQFISCLVKIWDELNTYK